ncbi:MAG: hypothetical protein ACOYM3_01055 [Terrimicrobiaceae bacterium]
MSGEYMENENEFRTVIRADGTVGIIPSLNSVMRSCDADGVVDMEHTMNPSGDGSNYEYAPRGTMARVLEYQQRIETLDRIAQSEMVLRATCETQAKMLRNAEVDLARMHERIVILETREVEQTEYTEQLERDYTAARAAACAWKQSAKTYRSEYIEAMLDDIALNCPPDANGIYTAMGLSHYRATLNLLVWKGRMERVDKWHYKRVQK